MNPAAIGVLRLPLWRSRAVVGLLVVSFVAVALRALYLQALNTEFLQERGEARYMRVLDLPATRGRILDRHGEALAISTPVKSIWAIPEDVRAVPPAAMRRLAELLAVDRGELEAKLADRSRDFVYLKRQVSPEAALAVEALRIAGVHQHKEFRRYYPSGEVVAHAVGFTGVDDRGQEGVELAHEAMLAGVAGKRRVIKDRLGHIVEDVETGRSAQDGQDLSLSLDGKIQSLAYEALKLAVAEHRAKAGAVVVLDVQSGEVLALANLPSYNPNSRQRLAGAQLRNRSVTDMFEPGSTMKPFTVALALEQGRLTPQSPINTSPGRLTIGSYTIHDAHPGGTMTVEEVIQKSSNVGAAKIALSLSRDDLWAFFRASGFGSAVNLGFPGEANGRVRPARSWRPIEQATMSYGHGISVNLVQLAQAYLIFARDGDRVPVSLRRVEGSVQATRVVSQQTARAIRAMLERAVQPGGTAPRARLMGWRVGGKTGTAHKQEHGGYAANKYISSFVGMAPLSAPRLVIAVMIDEPSAGQYYGGSVAAPVFAQIMQGALRRLDVPYDAPLVPVSIPGEGEQAREST